MRVAIIISPNWKEYAQRYLSDCLESVRALQYTNFNLFLVDNESSPETLSYLREQAPEAEIIALEKNQGFAGGNNAALRRVLAEDYDYAFLINMDTVLEPDCLGSLVEYAEAHPRIGALQPRIMLWPEKDLINSLGNETHFLGFGFCAAYRKKYKKEDTAEIQKISYASGAGVLFRSSALKQIGLFDEEFWMYNEDQDICLRLQLAAWDVCVLARAVMYHKYEFSRSITKYYWMDRNRIIVLLKNCRLATLLLIAPAFIVMEFGLLFFSIKSGWFKEKLRVWAYFISIKHWRYILSSRRAIQSSRVISDRLLSSSFAGKIWYQEIADAKLRLVNPIFNAYWKIVRLIMFW